MRSLAAINKDYEEIIHRNIKEPFKSRKLAELMTELEREYKVPALRNEVWERKNRAVIALYRKISLSRSL